MTIKYYTVITDITESVQKRPFAGSKYHDSLQNQLKQVFQIVPQGSLSTPTSILLPVNKSLYKNKTLKISASLALIVILSFSMLAAVQQSYAQSSQDRNQKQNEKTYPKVALGLEKNNENLQLGQSEDDDDDDDGISTALSSGRGNKYGLIAAAERKSDDDHDNKSGHALGASSVIIAKNSAAGWNNITILTKSLKKITVNVTSSTKIIKNGGTNTSYLTMYSRLSIGDNAHVKFSVNGSKNIATYINAVTPSQINARGNVTTKTTNSITIQIRNGETLTLIVTTTPPTSPLYTVITKGGNVTSFANVVSGDNIKATFVVQPDGTFAAITIHMRATET